MNEYPSHDDELAEPLRSAVEQILAVPILPVEVERALSPLRRMGHPESAANKRWPWRSVGISALAASLLIGLLVFQSSLTSAWAEVVAAVAGRPWLHASGKSTRGEPIELWYSAKSGVMATKMGQGILFSDLRQGAIESYGIREPKMGTIHREAISAGNRERIAEQGLLFRALLAGKAERSGLRDGAEIIEKPPKRITVDGQPRDEYRFVISQAGVRSETKLLVDPKTHLPTRWIVTTSDPAGGQSHGFTCEVDYPDSGPQSIYALGVPRSAAIVDNVPRGDLKRILEGLALARTRFDNYRGVSIMGSQQAVPDTRDSAICYQVWRQGLKWRIEQCQPKGRDAIPADAEPGLWWNQQVANSRVMLKSLSDGQQHCQMIPVFAEPSRPDAKRDIRPLHDKFDPWREYSIEEMPDFVGHPPLLGEGNSLYTMTVNLSPDRGPPSCVLVESLQADNTPRKLVGRRYWIDPSRDYLLMRDEALTGSRDKLTVWQASETTATAQSPSGRWFPQQVRVIGGTDSLNTGEKSDFYNTYYLDFEAKVADELFRIPPE